MFARFGKKQVVQHRATADDPATTPSTPPAPPAPPNMAPEEPVPGHTHQPTPPEQDSRPLHAPHPTPAEDDSANSTQPSSAAQLAQTSKSTGTSDAPDTRVNEEAADERPAPDAGEPAADQQPASAPIPDRGTHSDDAAPADDTALDNTEVVTVQLQPATALMLDGQRPRPSGRRLAKKKEAPRTVLTPEQRLLLLDTWQRSGLSAGDFASLVGISKHTLYKWKQLFTEYGPEGLMDQPRGGGNRSNRLSEVTRRAILMMKQANPEWGCQRISDMLARGPALPASASTVARVLKEAGYETVLETPVRHIQKERRFERAKPNQLWQTDLFTFVLKRQNRRLYLIAFLDDHSRFLVSFGLVASATTAQVIEVLEAGIASYGPPEEVLTDNGPQYTTWRGKSRFTRHLEKRGIRQIVARPKRPQTLGKIERFWGTLWREFLETAIFTDLEDARRRIGYFIDDYNFFRVHRGIDGAVPAERFFSAAPDVLRTLKERVAANALELARHGVPKKPFYVTGHVDGRSFSIHSEGERLVLRRDDGVREDVTLAPLPASEDSASVPAEPVCPHGARPELPGEPAEAAPPQPGQSAIPLPQSQADRRADEARDGKEGLA